MPISLQATYVQVQFALCTTAVLGKLKTDTCDSYVRVHACGI